MAAKGNVGGPTGHGLHETERVVHFHQPGLRVALLQQRPLRRAAYHGDALAIQRLGLCRESTVATGNQNAWADQVGAGIAQLFRAIRAIAQGANHLCIATGQALDHRLRRVAFDRAEVQPRAQRNLFQQVQGDAGWAVFGVVERQWRQRGVDQDIDVGVCRDPGFLFLAQGGEVTLQQQAGVATVPAAQDIQPLAVGDAR